MSILGGYKNTNFPKTARIFKYHNSLKKSEF